MEPRLKTENRRYVRHTQKVVLRVQKKIIRFTTVR